MKNAKIISEEFVKRQIIKWLFCNHNAIIESN